MTEFKPVKRRELIVWLYSLKQLKILRKYGYVHYISNRLKYVVLYVNEADKEKVKQQIEQYHFVRKVDESFADQIDMTFKDAIPNRIDPDKKVEVEQGEAVAQSDHFLQDLVASLEKKPASESEVSEVQAEVASCE